MNANLRPRNRSCYLHLWRHRCGRAYLRIDGVHLWWSGADERERNGVPSWIAPVQMRHIIVGVAHHRVVFMGRQAVVVLGMIVITVGVRVQR